MRPFLKMRDAKPARPGNQKNRKGVQGKGVCEKVTNPIVMAHGIGLLFKKYPDLHDVLTVPWILENVWGTKLWAIKPGFVKYFDDEIYGENESEEFELYNLRA